MTGKARNEVEVVEEEVVDAETVAEVEPYSAPLPTHRVWEAADEYDRVEGFDLEKNKMDLVGVPFIITKVYFREGKFARGKEILPDDFVSLELVTAPTHIYHDRVARNRRRYTDMGVPSDSPIGPNEEVVINDSSTGIKRQICWYLHSRGFLQIPGVPENFSDLSGSIGDSRFDLSRDMLPESAKDMENGLEIRLLVRRGLRPSKYENEYTPEGITYYLA